ncbi:MAG: hypothetical protein PHI97_01970 [Desulfobulbus sp.]|nr:hypothetical protein [Desulfobulbus sp.]
MSVLVPKNIEELVAEYKRLWPLIPMLHRKIAKLVDKNAIKACAKRLRIFTKQDNKLVMNFESEYETELFQDYLIYMYRPRGFSFVRQMRNRKPYPVDSDEQSLLEGMHQARFSVFWVKELLPVGGMVVLDVITGEELFVLDQSLPQQEMVGLLAAFRIFPFRDVWLHTGASMAFGIINEPEGLKPLGRHLNDKEEQELNEDNFLRWRAMIRDQR